MTRVRFSRICISCGLRFVPDHELLEPPQRYCSEGCERQERQSHPHRASVEFRVGGKTMRWTGRFPRRIDGTR